MKFTTAFLLIGFTLLLANNEFKYIQPISVEKAPQEIKKTTVVEVVQTLEDNTTKTKIEETPKVDKDETIVLKVSFKANSADITKKTMQELQSFADFLQENEDSHAIIYGHTDSSGSEEKNLLLSQARADTIKKALITLGVNEIRLTAIGKGSQDPIADNSSFEGREKNRRIEVQLLQ